MKNEYNSEGKDIRFIDSHYQDYSGFRMEAVFVLPMPMGSQK